MKIFFFFIFILLNNKFLEETIPEVVNSCGSGEYKTSGKQPTKREDCFEEKEPACKLVTISKDGSDKKFCAIIHGKYNDEDVKKEIENLINAKISIEKGFYIKTNYMLILLLIEILL